MNAPISCVVLEARSGRGHVAILFLVVSLARQRLADAYYITWQAFILDDM